MVEILAYAKINLYLDVENKRADGYHNIVSVMQSIDWCDKIQISIVEKQGIFLTCSTSDIPTDERNTAHKAANIFLQQIHCKEGIAIHIEKQIPHEAGMAGGSADAAATLNGLNQLFKNPLSKQDLLALGLKIGADVPFCMNGGTKLVRGIGEKLSAFPSMPDCFLVCAKPKEGISTPAAYAELDRKYSDFITYVDHRNQLETLRSAFERNDMSGVSLGLYNIFEETVSECCPTVEILKKHLTNSGAICTLMSGSGPSVFGIFDDLEKAEKACRNIHAISADCRVCRPLR